MTGKEKRSERNVTRFCEPILFEGGLGGGVMTLAFVGVKTITSLSKDEVELLTESARITVLGTALSLNVFERSSVEIKGRIQGVTFKYGKG